MMNQNLLTLTALIGLAIAAIGIGLVLLGAFTAPVPATILAITVGTISGYLLRTSTTPDTARR